MRWLCVLVGLSIGCGRFGFTERSALDGSLTPTEMTSDTSSGGDASSGDASASLVARFSMDDDPQSGMITAVPAGYSVSCGGACPTATIGRIGGGYAFSGGGWFPIGHTELVTGAPFTVALWIRVAAQPSNYMVPLAKPRDLSSNFNVFAIGVLMDGTAWYESSLGNNIATVSTGTTIVGSWHHMTARWDGTTRALFLDGTLTNQQASGFDDSTVALGLGGDLDSGTRVLPFIGDMDELQFFARALDDSEIAALANP